MCNVVPLGDSFLRGFSYDYITNLQLSEETKLSDLTENTHCLRLFNEQDIECYTKLNPPVHMNYFWAILQPEFICLSVVKLQTKRLLSFQI